MDDHFQRLPRTLWLGLGLFIFILSAMFVVTEIGSLNAKGPALPVLSPVADFALTNQFGQPVTLANLRDHVWIADIIFTRCAGPCPRMTQQMKSLQDDLTQSNPAKLVTLTTDPTTTRRPF